MSKFEVGKFYKSNHNNTAKYECLWSGSEGWVYRCYKNGKVFDPTYRKYVEDAPFEVTWTETKPRIKRTYWLAHFTNDSCSFWGPDAEKNAKRYKQDNHCLGITGPHTVEFEEGEGLN